MTDSGSLATVASVIAAFCVAVLVFRIGRELEMQKQGEINWIPLADWLLIMATLLSLFVVIVPILLISSMQSTWTVLPRAGAAAACAMLGGYIFAILAHYRLIFGTRRVGPRQNPEPAERAFFWLSIVGALALSLIVAFLRGQGHV
jgi:hypothetical protein